MALSGPDGGAEGTPLTFVGSFTDPGADTHTLVWSVTRNGAAFPLPPGTPNPADGRGTADPAGSGWRPGRGDPYPTSGAARPAAHRGNSRE